MNKSEFKRLEILEKEIKQIAEEEGLTTKDIVFEVTSPSKVMEGMAYHFPINFSHWSHGRDYDRARTIYETTLEGIPYEQVWNFDQPKALLVDINPFALQVMILAHVYGHVDFFHNNRYCQRGREFSNLALEARNAAERFRRYEERYGEQKVEKVIDSAYSIRWQQHPDVFYEEQDEEKVRDYLIELEKAKLFAGERPKSITQKPMSKDEVKAVEAKIRRLMSKTPPEPTHDLLSYIIKHSPKPLKPWMLDILSVIRNQSRSLLPNGKTKILNEGWATYWHVRIMRRLFERNLITPEEHGTFSSYHAKVVRKWPKGMNPYNIGLAIYEDVEDRWNKGRFGKEYEECRDHYKRSHWDTKAGLGRQKIFEVRELYSDRLTIDELFNDDFIRAQLLYLFQNRDMVSDVYEVVETTEPAVIREILKRSLTLHAPVITVEDGNLNGNGFLVLKHHSTGYDLDPEYCHGTLRNIAHLWGRAVYLETVEDGMPIVWVYDDGKIKKLARNDGEK